jgi:AcrR family transcriptional regulator
VRTKTVSQADKMLEAAAHLFSTQRFHEVRMEDIAAEADVGKGTLYRYFKDKEELYLALLDRASGQLIDQLTLALADIEGARARLVNFVSAVLEFFDEQPHLFDLIQRAEVLRSAGSDFPWQKARDESQRLLTEIFQKGKDQGDFAIRDAEVSSLMFQGGLRSVVRFGIQPRPADIAARIVDVFMNGADAGTKARKELMRGCN